LQLRVTTNECYFNGNPNFNQTIAFSESIGQMVSKRSSSGIEASQVSTSGNQSGGSLARRWKWAFGAEIIPAKRFDCAKRWAGGTVPWFQD